MDLTSRLRAIVRPANGSPNGNNDARTTSGGSRELTYEPAGGFESTINLARVGQILGGRTVETTFKLIEPILLVFMAVAVGFIVFALFMPLITMMQQMSTKR